VSIWEISVKTARPVKITPTDLLTHLAKTKAKYPKF